LTRESHKASQKINNFRSPDYTSFSFKNVSLILKCIQSSQPVLHETSGLV